MHDHVIIIICCIRSTIYCVCEAYGVDPLTSVHVFFCCVACLLHFLSRSLFSLVDHWGLGVVMEEGQGRYWEKTHFAHYQPSSL